MIPLNFRLALAYAVKRPKQPGLGSCRNCGMNRFWTTYYKEVPT
jgi:hypothetical protein